MNDDVEELRYLIFIAKKMLILNCLLFSGEYADDIYFDDIVTGKELQNEITIVAHF